MFLKKKTEGISSLHNLIWKLKSPMEKKPQKLKKTLWFWQHFLTCYDMGQNDTIGKIELKPSIVLSSDNTNCKNDIQLFHQLFDELSVYRDYH